MTVLATAYDLLRQAAGGLNSSVGRLCLRLLPEQGGLIVLAFHAVVRDAKERHSGALNPRYVVTVDQFEQCVRYFLSRGFRAVSPHDIMEGLAPAGRYVLFTFDDGYANNLWTVPVLDRYRVPALFALATDYVARQRPFWWDVIYQQRSSRGWSQTEIDREADGLLHTDAAAIEQFLSEKFGADVARTTLELARPMTRDEVKKLACHPLVYWANHTARHENLVDCSETNIRDTLGRAQETLQELTGARPVCVVYPYGSHNKTVRGICRELGLCLGFTMAAGRYTATAKAGTDGALAIPRFAIFPDRGVAKQCAETRLSWKPSWLLRGRPTERAANRG